MVAGMEYDYLAVDDLISVIVNPSFGTGTPQQVNNVCRGVVTIQESEKSRGAIQAGDTMFLISELEMEESLPEIGALINPLDEEGTWYTVLKVMKDRDSRVWHCAARDLSVSLSLGQLASQERREEVQTGSGSTEFTWTEIATDLPTRVQPMSATMKEEYGVEELDVSHVLYFTNTLDTSETDRFVVDGNYYYVRGWKQAETLGEPFIVMAEKGASTGVPFRSSSGKSDSRSRRS
jgi:hypothetical protein